MTSGWSASRKVVAGFLIAGAGAALMPMPAIAQDDARVRKLESEVRALQRAVFPGSDGRYFTPEVDTSPGQQVQQPVAVPTTSALTDVLARLDALEAQLARLTARSEENTNELAQLRTQLAELQAAPPPAQDAVTPPTGIIGAPGSPQPPAVTPAAATQVRAPTTSPSPARLAAVQAIAKPSTGDAGDDEYTYGFRLWEAGYYPEARQQLSLFVQRYPNHSRTSFGRNLLGRAFLDDGQPREAATHFLENYQKDKQGARAPDSLLFLAEAMIALNDTNRACVALAEFGDNYPALATGRLKEQYDRGRGRVRCGG